MTAITEALSYDNPVFKAYVFWSSILAIKMLAMSVLTGRKRHQKKVVPNPEDAALLEPGLKPSFNDPDVERIRRAHLNDLENCLPFMAVGFFYVLTNPGVFLATNLFRAAVLARIVHTIVYAIFPMQPARGIAWFVCYAITAFMALQSALYFI